MKSALVAFLFFFAFCPVVVMAMQDEKKEEAKPTIKDQADSKDAEAKPAEAKPAEAKAEEAASDSKEEVAEEGSGGGLGDLIKREGIAGIIGLIVGILLMKFGLLNKFKKGVAKGEAAAGEKKES